VCILSDGRVSSFWDRVADREVIDLATEEGGNTGRGANHLVVYDDVPFFWDSWDTEIHHLQKRREVPPASSIRIIEAGPLRVCVEVKSEQLVTTPPSSTPAITTAATSSSSPNTSMTQLIYLCANSMLLEFSCTTHWEGVAHKFLKVEFPLVVRPSGGMGTFGVQYGHVSRPTHANRSEDLARFESAAQQRWVDLSESGYGAAVIADSKYGFAAHGSTIRLSLLRSPKKPDDQVDMGVHEFRYALLPHQGGVRKGRVVQQAAAFVQPIRVVTTSVPAAVAPTAASQGE
jgi:alpha-mannosidase